MVEKGTHMWHDISKLVSKFINYKFLAKFLDHYFQIFFIFIDKILSVFQNSLMRW